MTCSGVVVDCARETLAVLNAVADMGHPAVRITRAGPMCIWDPFLAAPHSCPAIIEPGGTQRVANAVVSFAGTERQAFLNPAVRPLAGTLPGPEAKRHGTVGAMDLGKVRLRKHDASSERPDASDPPPQRVPACDRGGRLRGTDPAGVAFNVYRAAGSAPPVKLNTAPIAETTNLIDAIAGELPTEEVSEQDKACRCCCTSLRPLQSGAYS